MNVILKKLIPLMLFASAALVFVYQSNVGVRFQHKAQRTTPRRLVDNEITSIFKGFPNGSNNLKTYSAKMSVISAKHKLNVYSKNIKKKTKNKIQKYIIYSCDEHHACAGWGDRQRGIVSAFLLANVTNRKFLINMTSPCNLNRFLVPNEYRWDATNFKMDGKTHKTVGGVRMKDYQNKIRFYDFNKIFPEDIIFLRTNTDLLNIIRSNDLYKNNIPPWALGKRYVAFRNAWNILTQPSPDLKSQIKDILSGVDFSKNDSLVCAHIRIGKNPDMPNDSPNRNDLATVPELWDFLKPYADKASRIFIATDSTSVRDMARMRFGKKSLDSGGKILHIDRQRKRDDACQGMKCVILDQVILTKCHILVVSASNFSIRAAFIRGVNKNLFIFKNGKVSPFVLP